MHCIFIPFLSVVHVIVCLFNVFSLYGWIYPFLFFGSCLHPPFQFFNSEVRVYQTFICLQFFVVILPFSLFILCSYPLSSIHVFSEYMIITLSDTLIDVVIHLSTFSDYVVIPLSMMRMMQNCSNKSSRLSMSLTRHSGTRSPTQVCV